MTVFVYLLAPHHLDIIIFSDTALRRHSAVRTSWEYSIRIQYFYSVGVTTTNGSNILINRISGFRGSVLRAPVEVIQTLGQLQFVEKLENSQL